MEIPNLRPLLPQDPRILSTGENDANFANEKSRSVKMCYTSYKLIVTFLMFCGIIIYLFVKDTSAGLKEVLKETHSSLNILREMIRFSTSGNANFTSQ